MGSQTLQHGSGVPKDFAEKVFRASARAVPKVIQSDLILMEVIWFYGFPHHLNFVLKGGMTSALSNIL